jgi:hypothetical protein
MPNYIEVIGCYYNDAEAWTAGDPTVYGNIVWETTPISQAELDAQPPCPTPEEVDLTNFFSDLED